MNYAECKESAKILRDVLCASPMGKSIIDKQIVYQRMNEVDKHRYNPAPVIVISYITDYANMALIYTERAFGEPLYFSSSETLKYNYELYIDTLAYEIQRIPLLSTMETIYLVDLIKSMEFPYYLIPLLVEEAGLYHQYLYDTARMN